MHRVFYIQEFVEKIMDELDASGGQKDLARLARTCRLFTDPALNRLWASRDNGVWLLTQRMSEDLLAIKMVNRVRWLSEQEQTVCVYNSRMRGARRQPRFPGAGMRLE
jgi:hypothetical protein